MKVIVDAVRATSGGAVDHLANVFCELDKFDIRKVDIYVNHKVYSRLSYNSKCIEIIRVNGRFSGIQTIIWQLFRLPYLASKYDKLIVVDAATFSLGSKGDVVIFQDLIAFEDGILDKYYKKFSRAYWRQIILRRLSIHAFRRCDKAIFMSNYQSKVIQGKLSSNSSFNKEKVHVVHHGVSSKFSSVKYEIKQSEILRCVYVSPVWSFKNHKKLIDFTLQLNEEGISMTLDFIGGNDSVFGKELIKSVDSEHINFLGYVEHEKLPEIIASYDLFIFASSCESFGITLLEGMSLGMPILCNKESSLSEILSESGSYFDVNDYHSFKKGINRMRDVDFRLEMAEKAFTRSKYFSWVKCSQETLRLL